MCENTTLRYFDTRLPSVIQVDASLKGLGAALLQEGQPVMLASKALTKSESNYANIERELLAVVFGVTRFHTFVYGSKFTVESDHQPLANIQHKSMGDTPSRLQRLMTKLQPYDYEIVYKPGREMVIADMLSRLNPQPGPEIDLEQTIYAVSFSSEKAIQLQDETNKDPEFHALKFVVLNGWPDSAKQLPRIIRHFWSCKDELVIDDGILLKGDRVMIPKSMRQEVLEKLHIGHQGTTKCQLQAKATVYWPGITKDIDELTRGCVTCNEYQNSQRYEPLMPHDIPTCPWEKIGIDLFHYENREYLLIVDYYSKCMFVQKMPTQCTSAAVIRAMKGVFGEHGIPMVVFSDNGSHFTSAEFRQFAEVWQFDHDTNSPYYSRSNGMAERFVQTVKDTLIKAKITGTDPDLALLALRTTPIDSHLPSPGELLSRRKLRSNLPQKLRNELIMRDEIRQRLEQRQDSQKYYHDAKGVRELPELIPGQHVSVQNQKTGHWEPCTVKEKCAEPQSYIVSTPNGGELRRNRSQLSDLSTHMPARKVVQFEHESLRTNTDSTHCDLSTKPVHVQGSNGEEPVINANPDVVNDCSNNSRNDRGRPPDSGSGERVSGRVNKSKRPQRLIETI